MPFSTDPFTAVSSNREDYAPYTDMDPVKSYKPLVEYKPTEAKVYTSGCHFNCLRAFFFSIKCTGCLKFLDSKLAPELVSLY